MAKQRIVNTKFWEDTYIQSLPAKEKLLYLYLVTSPSSELCGAYEIATRLIQFHTGLPEKFIEAALDKFTRDGKIFYERYWVIIKNFPKHQAADNPKVMRGVARSLAECPDWVQTKVREHSDATISGDVHKRGHQIAVTIRRRIMERDGNKCVKCGETEFLTIDHIQPRVAGGTDEDANLRVLCRSCNGKRNAELRWNSDGSIDWMGEGSPTVAPIAPMIGNATPIAPTLRLQLLPELEPQPTGIGEDLPELTYPVRDLVEAFPDYLDGRITSGMIGLIEATVLPGDEEPWRQTLQKYRENFNVDTKRYLPDKTGNLLDVFRDFKAKAARAAREPEAIPAHKKFNVFTR